MTFDFFEIFLLSTIQGISEFIPVWEGQKIVPPDGYKYIGYEDVGGRIGAFVK